VPASVGDPAPGRVGGHEDDTFSTHQFRCAHGTLQYRLFVPSGTPAGAPLLVMLHGCTQSPDDFARGTRMNSIARERGCVVAYPAQAHKKNSSRCWNWFRDGDQQRGRGEPALIASLALHLVEEHRLDARRVYAAGLSAGGAMAAILGATYPDVFAAVGIHSGLPFGAARDLPSALAAMKGGAAPAPLVQGVPAIVFHGDRDATVDPCNGEAVVAQFTETTGAVRDGLQRTVERGSIPGGRGYTRISYRTADGKVMAEHWEVHGAGHAWFGGDPSGSYTDPSGPDASEHMLRFFAECVRAPAN
jgi:poly(hydroxyalkanoate) depolymerase family esterase